MKTFDEAVMIAMVSRLPIEADDSSSASQEELNRPISLQCAFKDDAFNNRIIHFAVCNGVIDVMAQMDEVPGSADDLVIFEIISNAMLSSLLWGVAIGREMEKQDA